MIMTIVKIILSFIEQPVLWVGLLMGYLISARRIKKERELYRVAINPRWVEWKHFLLDGLLFGLFFSFLALFIGVVLPPYFIVIYQIVAIVFLALSFFLINPTIVLSLVSVLVLLYAGLKASFLNPVLLFFGLSTTNSNSDSFAACLLFLIGITSALTGFFVVRRGTEIESPLINKSSRGRFQAFYPLRQLAMAPVFFLIPGDTFSSNFGIWPSFALGQNRYSLFILPIFIGFFIKVAKEVPEIAAKKAARWYFISALVYFVLGIVALFLTSFSVLIALVAFFVSLGFDIAIANSGNGGNIKYVDVKNGVRVLTVMPGTPAEKMELEAGDIILLCNDQPVNDENSFYQAIQSNLTFCHLKVKNLDGEIRMCETAIYSDSPHKLGVVMFPETDEEYLEDEIDDEFDESEEYDNDDSDDEDYDDNEYDDSDDEYDDDDDEYDDSDDEDYDDDEYDDSDDEDYDDDEYDDSDDDEYDDDDDYEEPEEKPKKKRKTGKVSKRYRKSRTNG